MDPKEKCHLCGQAENLVNVLAGEPPLCHNCFAVEPKQSQASEDVPRWTEEQVEARCLGLTKDHIRALYAQDDRRKEELDYFKAKRQDALNLNQSYSAQIRNWSEQNKQLQAQVSAIVRLWQAGKAFQAARGAWQLFGCQPLGTTFDKYFIAETKRDAALAACRSLGLLEGE